MPRRHLVGRSGAEAWRRERISACGPNVRKPPRATPRLDDSCSCCQPTNPAGHRLWRRASPRQCPRRRPSREKRGRSGSPGRLGRLEELLGCQRFIVIVRGWLDKEFALPVRKTRAKRAGIAVSVGCDNWVDESGISDDPRLANLLKRGFLHEGVVSCNQGIVTSIAGIRSRPRPAQDAWGGTRRRTRPIS
jgi:hypothetical protein